MIFKRLFLRLKNDFLYDWYVEVKSGKESIINFAIHWGLWVGGFILVHLFWAMILYFLFVIDLEYYQFIIAWLFIVAGYILLWVFVDKFYKGDRPIKRE